MVKELATATFMSILLVSFYFGFIGSDIIFPSACTFGVFLGHLVLYVKRGFSGVI